MILFFRRLWARLTATLSPARHEETFQAEAAEHLELMVEAGMARGLSEREARREARARMGGMAQLAEQHRDWRGLPWLDGTLRDGKDSFRSLRRDPRFFAVAMGVAAVGVGATTAVISGARQTFFRPLPYANERQIVSFGIQLPWVDREFLFGRAYAELRDLWGSGEVRAISGITSMTAVQDCEMGDPAGARKRLLCAHVEWNFLPTLGVRPDIGDPFAESDDEPGAAPAAMLSHHVWVSHFGGQKAVTGKTIALDGLTARVAGVLPRGFELPTGEPADLVVTQRVDYAQQRRSDPGRVFRLFARLRDGASPAVAVQLLDRIMASDPLPANARRDLNLRVRSIRELRFRDIQLATQMLMSSAGFLFLITCGNIGFLLLARGAARRRERAVRMALGAGRASMVRRSLADGLLIALPGGLAGCGLAYLLLQFANAIVPPALRTGRLQMDPMALLAAATLAMLAGVFFGVIAIVPDRRAAPLQSFDAAGAPAGGNRLRQALVVAQIALCIVLVGGTATLLRSLWQLRAEGSTLGAEQTVTASFLLPRERYGTPEAQAVFYRQLEERLGSIAGMQAVAVSDSTPPYGITRSQPLRVFQKAGSDTSAGMAIWRFVSVDYLKAMRIPVVRGRGFQRTDLNGGPVVVVNEAFARRIFGLADAVGQTIPVSGVPSEIVGVAMDVRNGPGMARPEPEFYALRQEAAKGALRNFMPPFGWRRGVAVVRTELPRASAEAALRGAIELTSSGMEVSVETIEDRFEAVSVQPRFQANVLGAFGLTGLVLAAAGLYGLSAFLSRERSREFAVRMALGATPGQVRGLVLRLAVRWVAMGGVLGIALGWGAARALRSAASGIAGADAAGFAVGAVVLGTVCLIGAWIPARRAAAVDPATALRSL